MVGGTPAGGALPSDWTAGMPAAAATEAEGFESFSKVLPAVPKPNGDPTKGNNQLNGPDTPDHWASGFIGHGEGRCLSPREAVGCQLTESSVVGYFPAWKEKVDRPRLPLQRTESSTSPSFIADGPISHTLETTRNFAWCRPP